MINIKRIYDKPQKRDGNRILVDRLWPRGIRREDVKLDLWMKEIAPSEDLRKWFGHDPGKWIDFKKQYIEELKNNGSVNQLVDRNRQANITLLYGSSDREHNNAKVLKEFIERKIS